MNATIRIDGVDAADGANTSVYLSSSTLDEMQIRTSGNDAEVSTPGTVMMGVIKSGSNEFHGTYNVDTERPQLQSNNISPALRAEGLSNTNPIAHLDDESGDLGGRIFRDKSGSMPQSKSAGSGRGRPRVSAISPDPALANNSPAIIPQPPSKLACFFRGAQTRIGQRPAAGSSWRFMLRQASTSKASAGAEPRFSEPCPRRSDYHNPTAMDKSQYPRARFLLRLRHMRGRAAAISGTTRHGGPSSPARTTRAIRPDLISRPGSIRSANPKTVIQYQNNWHFQFREHRHGCLISSSAGVTN